MKFFIIILFFVWSSGFSKADQNLISARLTYISHNWRHGNISHNYSYYNGRLLPVVILKRGNIVVGYAVFEPYQTKPFIVSKGKINTINP